MYITRDYLKVGSWEAIIDMINNSYNFQLYPGIVTLKEMRSLGGTRTQIEIIPNRSTNPINLLPTITETVFTYDRLDCTSFFRNTIALNVRDLKLPISTLDILEQIAIRNDIVFEPDDFVHQTFDRYTEFEDPDLVIVADPHSLRFVGQLKVRLVNNLKVNLAELTTPVNEFPNTFWQPQPDKVRGDYTLTKFDFTGYREVLKDIPVGLYATPKKLLGPIYKVSNTLFTVSREPEPFNLTHAVVDDEAFMKVLYNGAVIPLWSVRSDYQKVLVIELSEVYATGIRGFLRLHYD